MDVVAMLKWTATILLVYISECHGESVDQENTSCVYSFHVPSSQSMPGVQGTARLRRCFPINLSTPYQTANNAAISVEQVVRRTTNTRDDSFPVANPFVSGWQTSGISSHELPHLFTNLRFDIFSKRIGVNHPAIVREIPHFDVFPAFPHFC